MNHKLMGLISLLLLCALYACVTAKPGPTHPTQEIVQDATIDVTDASATVDAIAINDSEAVEASPAVELIEVIENVDHTPEFIEYIHTAMKEWVHIPCSNDGKDCQCFWNPDPSKVEACVKNYDNFYKEIATTIVEVISESGIVLPITGDNYKVKSALLMTSIAAKEGGFHKEIDSCKKTGDNGRALGLWQTWSSPYGVCRDRKIALRYAIKVVMQSFDACKNLPLQFRLTAYASGNCTNEHGRSNSKYKINRAIDYLAAHPYTDQ